MSSKRISFNQDELNLLYEALQYLFECWEDGDGHPHAKEIERLMDKVNVTTGKRESRDASVKP